MLLPSQRNHSGKWQDCKKCKASFPLENYVDDATHTFNFEKLANPPKVVLVVVIELRTLFIDLKLSLDTSFFFRTISNQDVESQFLCTILNQMTELGMPKSVKIA